MASEHFSIEASAPSNSATLQNGGNKQQLRRKQRATDGYPIPALPFPTTFSSDPTTVLSPLRDKHSSYDAVARTCLVLNQFAANGSSKATAKEDDGDGDGDASFSGSVNYVESSSLFHDSSFAQILSESFASLIECIREHDDRRCRILACKTVALVARAAYARLRHSPHALTGMRDDNLNSGSNGTNNATAGNNYISRLDDEVGTDVPMALCMAALEDSDDGVAATAITSLGSMVLSTVSTPGAMNDDELWTEVRSILQVGQQPYAPSARLLVDEDSSTQQSELQVRIYENTICPRLLQLVSRFLVLNHPSHVSMVLPTLTASLVYLSKTSLPTTGNLMNDAEDKAVSSLKRRVGEPSDCNALTEMVVNGMLLPWMQEPMVTTMGASMAAAFSSIRLIHAYPLAPWTKEVSLWAIAVLKEECRNNGMGLEAQLPTLATLIILSRAVPLPERVDTVLEFVVDRVLDLPSTTMVPSGVVSAGLFLDLEKQKAKTSSSQFGGFMAQFRKPTRPAFWAEIALSFFLDGQVESSGTKNSVRSDALAKFLNSPVVLDIMDDQCGDDTATGTHSKIREEFVTAFCMVAFQVGRRHRTEPENTTRGVSSLIARREELEEWIQLSLALLNAFSPCIGWGSVGFSTMFLDEEISMLVACQAAYTRLLQEVLHAAGLLGTNSISLKMTPFTSPPQLLWDQMEEASDYLLQFDAMPLLENMVDPIGNLMDEIVKKEMRGAGIVSHHMRVFLMTFAVDQWIQARQNPLQKGALSQNEMNVDSAKQLLVTISPRRMFGKVVESNRSQMEKLSTSKKEKYKKYAQDTVNVCVACIENMALVARHYTSKFGENNETKAILNYSVKSLQGKSGNDSDAPVSSVCQAAIERMQTAFQSGDKLPSQSTLVPDEFKRRSVVGSSRIAQGRGAFNEGYMTQLSRQIISTRAERCILSFPAVSNVLSKVRKQNCLRLSLPPLPHSQDSCSAVSSIPRFDWGSNVAVCTAGSDPAAVTLSHYLRRSMRYDGEDDFRLVVTMRVDNLIAAEIPNGLRLELGITEENTTTSVDAQDAMSMEISNSLTEGYESGSRENVFGYSTVTYKRALKSGDHVTWDFMLNPLSMTGSISLNPSIVFRALDKEPPHAAWVTADNPVKEGEEASTMSGSGNSRTGGLEGTEEKENAGKDETQNVSVSCEGIKLSPMIGLQPCPLVFFRNSLGDIESFRFLWSRMPYNLTPFKLVADSSYDEESNSEYDAMRLAALSSVKFDGDPVPGGMITELWAFISPKGKRVLFVLGEQDGEGTKTLHVRSDDKQLLLCLVGTSSSRNDLISALKPGLKPWYQEIFHT
eukprot:CAMPEP_0116110662 /NCGR_PEP_ID=MMETSP0327-20121206/18029_1 /TAXON_ID=44447 /ORGANISM="Pseudo-nitzschia delicatissima, Strain B596" /LENGTH=1325 /DNA_ID=CAMNT_0003603837 /DNA_START=88 /DNA_END=4065 /DNA_ORIENTATION=-